VKIGASEIDVYTLWKWDQYSLRSLSFCLICLSYASLWGFSYIWSNIHLPADFFFFPLGDLASTAVLNTSWCYGFHWNSLSVNSYSLIWGRICPRKISMKHFPVILSHVVYQQFIRFSELLGRVLEPWKFTRGQFDAVAVIIFA